MGGLLGSTHVSPLKPGIMAYEVDGCRCTLCGFAFRRRVRLRNTSMRHPNESWLDVMLKTV